VITYSIDAERKLVITISSGVLNLEQIHAHLDRLKGDPAFRSDFNQLLDLRDVTRGYRFTGYNGYPEIG